MKFYIHCDDPVFTMVVKWDEQTGQIKDVLKVHSQCLIQFLTNFMFCTLIAGLALDIVYTLRLLYLCESCPLRHPEVNTFDNSARGCRYELG